MIQEQFVRARALDGYLGEGYDGQPTAFVDFEIIDGEDTGQKITYRGRVDQKSAKYVARDLKAIGWSGKTLDTLKQDVAAATPETTIEIKHMNKKDGSGKFPVVRSIGRTASGQSAPPQLKQADVKNADALLRAALGDSEPVDPDASNDIPF
jgi:tRNA U34 5-carboxymethylaminomethyl modifying enzyme MnmG/GidA